VGTNVLRQREVRLVVVMVVVVVMASTWKLRLWRGLADASLDADRHHHHHRAIEDHLVQVNIRSIGKRCTHLHSWTQVRA
jgi:hypothetical protein